MLYLVKVCRWEKANYLMSVSQLCTGTAGLFTIEIYCTVVVYLTKLLIIFLISGNSLVQYYSNHLNKQSSTLRHSQMQGFFGKLRCQHEFILLIINKGFTGACFKTIKQIEHQELVIEIINSIFKAITFVCMQYSIHLKKYFSCNIMCQYTKEKQSVVTSNTLNYN